MVVKSFAKACSYALVLMLAMMTIAASVGFSLTRLSVANASSNGGSNISISEFNVPTAQCGPFGITAGPDGAIWFSENGCPWQSNKVGRVDMNGTVSELNVSVSPRRITCGPDGALWFTADTGPGIGRLSTSGAVTGFTVSEPEREGITVGPDGALWFAELSTSKIGRITTSGTQTEYDALSSEATHPCGITTGPDSALWFTGLNDTICRMTTSGAVTAFAIPTSSSSPDYIVRGPDGALWFTESTGNKIGRCTTSGAITEFSIPTANSGPGGITVGSDGALWFTEATANKLGRIDTASHQFTEYNLLTQDCGPDDILTGPDGALWFTEYRGNKVGRAQVPPPTPPVPPPDQWKSSFYFAEGYTGANFQEYACLGNPNTSPAAAWITCMYADGSTYSQYYGLAPSSRLTVDMNQLAGPGKEVSMRVVSTSAGIVAERPMYFNYNGIWTGGSDAIGATSPMTKWYFAEGNTLSEFDQYITVLNPGDSTANLTFHYMIEGQGERNVMGKVGAHSRATFKTRDQLGANLNESLFLESDQNIVAERPMYFNYLGLASNNWTGGHDVVGTNSPNNDWYFAEGTTRKNSVDGQFEQWLCLQNPGTAPITVSATYQLAAGQGNPVSKSYTVGGSQRLTVSVNRELGQDKDCSVYLRSSSPFIAERPLYFDYHNKWTGGHDVLGANSATTDWFFAEGTTRQNFDEWLCLQNPGNIDAHTTVTYYTASGQIINKNWTVKSNTRLTVSANSDIGPNQDISARVTSDQPIIAERPMYFNYNGWDGGHDVVGFVPPR